MYRLDEALIEQAHRFLQGKVRKTPMEFSPVLSEKLKVPVYLKLDFLQITGSFKARGALFYLSTLSAEEKHRGVAACSAGNHGLAVAYAAKQLGVSCTIFLPKSVEPVKYHKIHSLGVEVKKSAFNGYDDTLDWALEQAHAQGLHFISAFDDERIMAGNGGSLAIEILNELPEAQNFIVPVGGGGLCSGVAYWVKAKNQNARVIGCQHQDSPALKLSLEQGVAVTRVPAIETVAGAIEGGIGAKCYDILKDRVAEVALASEKEIIEGWRWLLEHHQYLIEPSSAVSIACALKMHNLRGPTVILLTGRNISIPTISKLL